MFKVVYIYVCVCMYVCMYVCIKYMCMFVSCIYVYMSLHIYVCVYLLPGWKVGSLIPGRVKPMTFKIDTCCFLVWHSALGQGLVSTVSR